MRLIFSMLFASMLLSIQAKPLELLSPDGKIKLTVTLSDKIRYDVSIDGTTVLAGNELALRLRNTTLGLNPQMTGEKRSSANESIRPVVPFKFSTVENRYNRLLLDFKGDYSVEFRAFNDGVAYRFVTKKSGQVEVLDETVKLAFPADYMLHLQYAGAGRGFRSVYEEPYSQIASQKWDAGEQMSVLPLLIDTRKGPKILFSEADVDDYPHMFLRGEGINNGATSLFPPAPLATKVDTTGFIKITKEADYIAKTAGTRSFPWRWFIVTRNDGQLLESTMVARLSQPCAIADPSWIQPGQAFWDYINRGTDYGPEVTYHQGINTPTFMRYIDFAARNHIPYVLIDAGWAKKHEWVATCYDVVDDLDLPKVVNYGKSKGVKIAIWMLFQAIQQDFEDERYNLFEHYSKMGVAGFKIDFMDRSDQWITRFYERAAQEAAKYRMVIEYHGSFKPVGLEYKYPNVLSYEGVRGLEYGSGTNPDNSVWLSFMRNVVGPMSFTPGSLLNTQPEHLRNGGWGYNWATIGTRAHHLACFVCFESGLQMLADSPRRFEENPDCAEFIFSVPVTWDETHALAAEIGKYAVVARRHGDKWWIGGIGNDCKDVEGRHYNLDLALDCLPAGKTFTLTLFEDGPNANGQAMDYNIRKLQVKRGDRIKVRLARNGGLAGVME